MTENTLTTLQEQMGLKVASKNDLKEAGLLGSSGGYLGELRVVSSGKLVNKHRMQAGSFCHLKDDQATALGEHIDIAVLAWRPKAVDFNEGESSYDATSDKFRDIFTRSGLQNSGCVAGPEFLVYLPTIKTFALYHANSISSRRVAGDLVDAAENGTLVHGVVEMAENKKKNVTWFVPSWSESDATIEPPSEELATEAVEAWKRAEERAGGSATAVNNVSSDREE